MNRGNNALTANARELMEQGWTTVPFPSAVQLAEPVVQGFINFLAEPQWIKDRWTIHTPGDPKPDDGYLRRDDNEHKDIFHFGPLLRLALAAHGVPESPHELFLDACECQYAACKEIMMRFLEAWCDVSGFDLLSAAQDVRSRRRSVLRTLCYDPVSPESVMAASHRDRSFLTLCVASSRGGLRVGKEMIYPFVPPHHALIFPGRKAEEATHGAVAALEHLVVEDACGADAAMPRWSQVFFFNIDPALIGS